MVFEPSDDFTEETAYGLYDIVLYWHVFQDSAAVERRWGPSPVRIHRCAVQLCFFTVFYVNHKRCQRGAHLYNPFHAVEREMDGLPAPGDGPRRDTAMWVRRMAAKLKGDGRRCEPLRGAADILTRTMSNWLSVDAAGTFRKKARGGAVYKRDRYMPEKCLTR